MQKIVHLNEMIASLVLMLVCDQALSRRRGNIIDWQDLSPSDYHHLGPKKKDLKGKHYASDEEMKAAVMKWLKEQSTQFYEAGINAFILKWIRAIERSGDNVEE